MPDAYHGPVVVHPEPAAAERDAAARVMSDLSEPGVFAVEPDVYVRNVHAALIAAAITVGNVVSDRDEGQLLHRRVTEAIVAAAAFGAALGSLAGAS